MPPRRSRTARGEFSIAEPGSVTAGSRETNVSVWAPALPTAFDKARDAAIWTRLGTRHSYQELVAAFENTPDVDQTFCLSVNNVILVFSASLNEHTEHVRKIILMLLNHSMSLDSDGCVFHVEKSTDAGIRLNQVGQHQVYMVINEGVPSVPRAQPAPDSGST